MYKIKFVHILAFTAFILAGTAAYFSVTGLAKLFSGAFLSVIIMIAGLELAKLVTASFLYRYWNDISKVFKAYLLAGVIAIMVITSSGIYGFLSSAYSVTANKMGEEDRKVEFLEKKKEIIQQQIDRTKLTINSKNNRIEGLTSIRKNQESRIDSLYKKNYINSVKRTEVIIKDANSEIEKTNIQIDDLSKFIQSSFDSISKIDLSILNLKSSDVNSEIGPLRYVSILTGKNINSVVNFFIFLLIFVFDPLAVCLVIATNKVMLKEQPKEKKKWHYQTTYN